MVNFIYLERKGTEVIVMLNDFGYTNMDKIVP